ncbi:Pyridoxal phosphate-dependent transferase [Naviculisporaceae sp. PSN 640]
MMSYHHDGRDVGSRVSGAGSMAADKAGDEKAPPLDLSHHFSFVSRNRLPNEMKKYYKLFQIPGIGNIAGGLPNVQFFPFDTLEAKTAKPERWEPTPNYPENENASTCGSSKSGDDPQASAKLAIPKILHETDITKKIDLETALQYGQAQGYPPLLKWIREFTRENLHPNVPYKDGPEVTLVCGSTDGFSKTLDVFVDAWNPEWHDVRDRPGLLCEEIVYPGILNQSKPRGVQIVPVQSDEHGMLAHGQGSLEDVLENWNPEKGLRPHLMYTVTLGHNPSGRVLPMERRKQLYAVCSKYDVIIVEDEPYWYLQYPSAATEEAKSRGQPLPIEEVITEEEEDDDDEFQQSLMVDSVYWHRQYLNSAIQKVQSRVRGRGADQSSSETPQPRKVSSGYEFLDSLQPSFLSVDTDGRVVRLDTFSKTIAPGCRLGWVTAAPAIIEKFIGVSESSTQQPSGFVQAMVAQLIMGPQEPAASSQKSTLSLTSLFGGGSDSSSSPIPSSTSSSQGWKKDGWIRWLEGLRGQYERRMIRMCRILDSGSSIVRSSVPASRRDNDCLVITKTPIFDYSWPRGGMFVWVRLLFETHPLWQAPWQSFVPPAAASFCSPPPISLSFCQEQRKSKTKMKKTDDSKQQEKQKQDPALIGGASLSAALMLYLTQKPHLVLVSTGALFSANETIAAEDGWRYFRLCFAAVGEEDVDATSQRFVDGVHAFWRVKDPRVIKKLLEPITGGKSAATTAVSLTGQGEGTYAQAQAAEEEGMESIVTRKMVGLDVTGKMGC